MADYLLSLRAELQDEHLTKTGDMLILTIIVLILALLFGKITIKEIKEYVRKHREGNGADNTGGKHSGNSSNAA
jgi:hypothetical protein